MRNFSKIQQMAPLILATSGTFVDQPTNRNHCQHPEEVQPHGISQNTLVEALKKRGFKFSPPQSIPLQGDLNDHGKTCQYKKYRKLKRPQPPKRMAIPCLFFSDMDTIYNRETFFATFY